MNTLESYYTSNPFEQTDECAKFVIDDPMSSFTLHNITEVGKEYTLAFWIKADEASKLLVASNSIPITTEWLRHIIVFTAKEKDLELLFRSSGNYYIYHIKLEKGNKATEWEMSAEDVAYDLDISIAELHNLTIEENTSILEDSRAITLQAMSSYVERNNGLYATSVKLQYLTSAATEVENINLEDDEWVDEYPVFSLDKTSLWVREIVTYSNDSTEMTTPRLIRTLTFDTDIFGLSSTNEYFGASIVDTDVTSDETVEWTSEVEVTGSVAPYLWKYEQFIFEDGTTIVTEPHLIGEYKPSFSEIQERLQAQLDITSDKIDMSFESTSKRIEELEGDVKQTVTDIRKYIGFSDNGIIIRSGDNALELQLDNEAGIIFSKNGKTFGTWDGIDFHTGNIVIDVNERAQFGNYAFIPRSDNSLMFLKVGG